MKKMLLASVIMASAIAVSSASFAGGVAMKNFDFGPTFEMQMNGKTMHMQLIVDGAGHKFVVVPAEDFEQAGSVGAHEWMNVGNQAMKN